MMLSDIFKIINNGILINIYLTPGSHKSCINGIIKTIDNKVYMKISVNSKPVENKANIELIDIISKYFNISKSNIGIKKGLKSRYKQIFLYNYNLDEIPDDTKKLLWQ